MANNNNNAVILEEIRKARFGYIHSLDSFNLAKTPEDKARAFTTMAGFIEVIQGCRALGGFDEPTPEEEMFSNF